MQKAPLKALDQAIEIFGSQQKLAEALGRKHQSYISQMRRRLQKGAVVPAEVCPVIEKLTRGKVKRAALNPKVAW